MFRRKHVGIFFRNKDIIFNNVNKPLGYWELSDRKRDHE